MLVLEADGGLLSVLVFAAPRDVLLGVLHVAPFAAYCRPAGWASWVGAGRDQRQVSRSGLKVTE